MLYELIQASDVNKDKIHKIKNIIEEWFVDNPKM
jgi:hypothetical protein